MYIVFILKNKIVIVLKMVKSIKKIFRLKNIIICLKLLFLIIFFNLSLSFFNLRTKKSIIIHNFESFKSYVTGNESACIIDTLNEWDPKIKNLFKITKPYDKCVKDEPLSYVSKENKLYINHTVNSTYYSGKIDLCEYAPVLRETTKIDYFKIENYSLLKNGTEIFHDFVKVRCLSNQSIVYEYVHNIILKKKIHDQFINAKNRYNNEPKINVMILVIDAVSLSSMKRALPKTLNYLKSYDNFFVYEKHHIVGENTFQNLVPMLTNLNPDDVFKNSSFTKKNNSLKLEIPEPFDDLPFIWKNFSSKNYVTYFSEEWKECTFNNLKFGFNSTPTDYYFRSYWLSLYDSLSYSKTILNSNDKPCYYNKLLHKMSTEWLANFEKFHLDLEKEHNIQNIPRFGLVKINEMSHDYLDRLFWIDDDIKNLINDLFTDKFLDKTLFILMGDHGHRFHPVRTHYIGKLEEKLPMFGMMVPRKIENKNVLRNLKLNTQ
ncbi:unnamed protein product, partial [Brachionus calyciflorus]